MTPAIALVSARAARALDADLPPLLEAFAAAGAQAEIVDWDDAGADWGRFDLVLLRSAWDYAERLGEFLAWAERTAARSRLRNPLAVVRWNADKHYLGELARAGLPVVPTSYVEPGTDAGARLDAFLAAHECAELVVKPAVGAGSRGSRRHARGDIADILGHMSPLLAAGRSLMLQPYLARVDREGETALIFIGGRYSHAIRKGPLLPLGAPATAGLFAEESIEPRVPRPDELAVAQRILAHLPFGELLYGRVDLIRDAYGNPCLLELELNEPSLYLVYEPGAAQRFVELALASLGPRGADRTAAA